MFKYLKSLHTRQDRITMFQRKWKSTIMHKQKNVGEVELATMSFGQSFQLSPIRILTTISAVINGGTMITPHFGVSISDTETQKKNKYQIYFKKECHIKRNIRCYEERTGDRCVRGRWKESGNRGV